MSEPTYTRVTEAAQVTEEILDIAQDTEEGWFGDSARIDWEDFIDRMDGTDLKDGTRLDLGDQIDSPAIRKIKRHVRTLREMG